MTRTRIAALILASIAGAFAIALLRPTSAGPSGVSTYVDVETGRVFRRSPGAFAALPANNEDTGRETIYPARSTESGAYQIPERYREHLTGLARTVTLRVDLETLIIEP